MIRFILLGAGITLLILGIGYIFGIIVKVRNKQEITPAQKKGLLAAGLAALVGLLLVYKNYNGNK
jgi:hypothetical protein